VLEVILVFIGGMIGSMLRYWWSGWVASHVGETFPYGTLVVNLAGSFVIGLVAGYVVRLGGLAWGQWVREFMAVGICGGLTTFSSFSLQTFNLILSKRWTAAVINIVISTAACLGLVALGWAIAGGW
jgi:fluoride exporter